MNNKTVDITREKHPFNYIPGIIASIAIYILAFFTVKFLPTLGIASFAIIWGVIFGNTLLGSTKLQAGTKFCESKLLEYSVVLLGASVSLSTIGSLGFKGVSFIIILMTSTIAFSYFLARKFGFSKDFALLLGAGNAVCGSSAIGASSRVLKSGVSETGLSITMVNILGTILMFFLPLVIIPIFFSDMLLESSALLGGILQSVGQVVAGAAIINEQTVKFALIFKIFRIIMLTFILIFFAQLKEKENEENISSEINNNNNNNNNVKKKGFKINIPWYIIGFFTLSSLTTINFLPNIFITSASKVGGFFEVVALAAIGLRVSFAVIKKEGPKSLLLSLIIGLFQTVLAIILIKVIF